MEAGAAEKGEKEWEEAEGRYSREFSYLKELWEGVWQKNFSRTPWLLSENVFGMNETIPIFVCSIYGAPLVQNSAAYF